MPSVANCDLCFAKTFLTPKFNALMTLTTAHAHCTRTPGHTNDPGGWSWKLQIASVKRALLASEQAERLGAYVGDAVHKYHRRATPVSTLSTPVAFSVV
eukprot:16738-Heterococcus_DN1.PRE.3